MGLISKILGSTKNADIIVKKGAEFIDHAFYTDEEKAENKVKLVDFYLKYQETTKGQNLARRMIALMLVGLYVALILMAVVVYPFNPLWSNMLFTTLKDVLMQPFNIVVAFYFGSHLLRNFRDSKK